MWREGTGNRDLDAQAPLRDNGTGMHCHQSLWKGGQPLFAGNGYAGLSDLALWYIAAS